MLPSMSKRKARKQVPMCFASSYTKFCVLSSLFFFCHGLVSELVDRQRIICTFFLILRVQGLGFRIDVFRIRENTDKCLVETYFLKQYFFHTTLLLILKECQFLQPLNTLDMPMIDEYGSYTIKSTASKNLWAIS